MSEQVNEAQAVQPGAEDTGEQQQQAAQPAPPPQQTQKTSGGDEETFPLRFVKRETGDVHWNVAKGIWETVVHGETGEPNSEYVLLATVDGVDVPILTANTGGVETIVKSQKALQQQSEG